MKSIMFHFAFLLASFSMAFYLNDAFGQSQQSMQKSDTVRETESRFYGFECSGLLRQLDKDQDGIVTRQEWQNYFDNHDQNGDQRLSIDEIEAGFQKIGINDEAATGPDQGRLAAFERLDKNKDGSIERSEWPGMEKDFRYLDADYNGSLSREEFLSRNGRFWNETFRNLDFNGDGIIVRSEWLDSNESFDRLDRDHNGAIESREFYNPR